MHSTQALFAYLEACVSPFHGVRYAKERLSQAGFECLDFGEPWQLEKGKGYYCHTFSGQFFAFKTGSDFNPHAGVRLAAAHTDWPCLRIKPEASFTKLGYLQANVEIYGSPILSTFFDRPLSVAGKVVTKGAHPLRPTVHYVDFKKPLMVIPNLAIHMNRSANEEGLKLDKQTHLMPILGILNDEINKDGYLLDFMAEELSVAKADILDYELCVYNLDTPTCVGIKDDFISSPRLDNITSVCAAIESIIAAKPQEALCMSALFDNEEIGSRTKQGADSSVLPFVLEKIWTCFNRSRTEYIEDLSHSLILSMDVAHGCHPNYANTNDLTNLPVLGKGFCIKADSNQKYTWDSEILATLKHVCQDQNIPYQTCVKRTGSAGGGTIGPMISAKIPAKTADIGVPLLSMHSSRELMGTKDQESLELLVTAIFNL